MNLEEIFTLFLKEQRNRIYDKDRFIAELFYQSQEALYDDIEYFIVDRIKEEYGIELDETTNIEEILNNKGIELDPREELVEMISEVVMEHRGDDDVDRSLLLNSSFQDLDLTPEKLWKKVWNYTATNLETYLFSRKLYGLKNRFSKESIEKLIELGTNALVDDIITLLIETRENEIEEFNFTISFINNDFANTEKVDLNFLFQKFHEEVVPNFYKAEDIFNINEDSQINAVNYVNDKNYNIKIRVEDIPKDLFSKEMLLDIQHLVDLFLLEHESLKHKQFARQTIYWIFLLYAYFGHIDGIIHGIKQGGIIPLQLSQDLSDFIKFNEDH